VARRLQKHGRFSNEERAVANGIARSEVDRGQREAGSRRRKAWTGFVVLGLMVAGHGALETARDTLLLSELPPSQLPFLYLAVAAAAVLLARNPLRRLHLGSQRSPPG
jgi:hypothetical protein